MATRQAKRLAIDGGRPAKTTPNLPMYPGGFEIGEDEEREVLDALRKKYLFRYYMPDGMTSKVAEFERRIAEIAGCRHAVAMNSCSSALISGLMACGVGPGHEVIVPAYTYWSTAAAVLCARAVPIIAEIDDSLTIDPEDIGRKITPRTRAIIPVHMRGSACDMHRIREIARRRGLSIIEDNAQACGGTFRGKPLGSFGDCAAFSFQYYKIITTGEGGMLTTDHERLYTLARSVHDSAGCWRPDRFAPARFPGELSFGYDFRMDEIAGALGLAQVRRLPSLLARMRSHKARIAAGIEDLVSKGIEPRRQNDATGDTAISLMFSVPTVDLCERFVRALAAEGVDASHTYHRNIPDWHVAHHWRHLIERATPTPEGYPFADPARGAPPPDYGDLCPRSADLLGRAVHINVPPGMTGEDCDRIAEAIRKVAEAYL
ncbi:MAG: DegT/DnrJ/EryC1/StrS family aminotransferase [Planctomycetes bacterium]|nr:DegT/DnrJ/EryC1/StrS family aminotransferase [Planctomycetota bacterium]